LIKPDIELGLSGERFSVAYQISGEDKETVLTIAEFLRVEQTIEYPLELVSPGELHDDLVGRIESIRPILKSNYEVIISYAIESAGIDLPQFLNVLFGNISFIKGIRVTRLDLPQSLLKFFKGPRFGRSGMRTLLNIPHRPILCTALKPMGLPPRQLATMAYQYAMGGIDIIKDDHGLSDQRFAPFQERVKQCVEAVRRANKESGFRCLYTPNISGPIETILKKAHFAKNAGADGLMVIVGIYGYDTLRMLAEDDDIGLPIIFHPGFLGTYSIDAQSGISPYVLHGQLSRLSGADMTIFPHHAGRFAPPQTECKAAADGTAVDMHNIKQNLPMPAGGIKPEFFSDMKAFYGNDVAFLVAGNLHRQGPNLIEASKYFRQLVEQI
jgi:ribulose-bisphosphate carboxylase large chain